MNRSITISVVIAFFVITTIPRTSHADCVPTNYIIGLDVSDTSPLITDVIFAEKSGRKIFNEINSLCLGSDVIVQIIGEYGVGNRSFNFHLTRKVRQQVASNIATTIASLSSEQSIKPSNTTNLLGFINDYSSHHRCSSNIHYTLITDGLEYSDMGNAYALIKNDGKLQKLNRDFAGCTISIMGIGKSLDIKTASSAEALRNLWRKWALANGFKKDDIRLISNL